MLGFISCEFYFVRESILEVRILGWFWNLWLVPFLVLAAPPVQTAGRGQTHLRRGAHSTCKLIFELCVGFQKLKVINPHIFYIEI